MPTIEPVGGSTTSLSAPPPQVSSQAPKPDPQKNDGPKASGSGVSDLMRQARLGGSKDSAHMESEAGGKTTEGPYKQTDVKTAPPPATVDKTKISHEEAKRLLGDRLGPDGSLTAPFKETLAQHMMQSVKEKFGENSLTTKAIDRLANGIFGLTQFGVVQVANIPGTSASSWVKMVSQIQVAPSSWYQTSDGKLGADITFFMAHDEIGAGANTGLPWLNGGGLYVAQHGLEFNVEIDTANGGTSVKPTNYAQEFLIRGEVTAPYGSSPVQASLGMELGMTTRWDLVENPDWAKVAAARTMSEVVAGLGAFVAANAGTAPASVAASAASTVVSTVAANVAGGASAAAQTTASAASAASGALGGLTHQVRFAASELARQASDRTMQHFYPPTKNTVWFNAATIGAADLNLRDPNTGVAFTVYPRENLGNAVYERQIISETHPQQDAIDARNQRRSGNGDAELGIM